MAKGTMQPRADQPRMSQTAIKKAGAMTRGNLRMTSTGAIKGKSAGRKLKKMSRMGRK